MRQAEPLLTIVQASDRETCRIQRRPRRGTPAVYQIRMGCGRKLSILPKSGIGEGYIVMDVRAHTFCWDRTHHAEHGDVRMQRGTFHESALQLFKLALVICEHRVDVRDSIAVRIPIGGDQLRR